MQFLFLGCIMYFDFLFSFEFFLTFLSSSVFSKTVRKEQARTWNDSEDTYEKINSLNWDKYLFEAKHSSHGMRVEAMH